MVMSSSRAEMDVRFEDLDWWRRGVGEAGVVIRIENEYGLIDCLGMTYCL